MDFGERLQGIGARKATEEQAKRDTDALRESASHRIRELLRTTAEYLSQQRIPMTDVEGTKRVEEHREVKRMLRAPKTTTYTRIISATLFRGWRIGELSASPDPIHGVRDPMFLTARGELFRGVDDRAIEAAKAQRASYEPGWRELPQPTKWPDSPEAVFPIYEELSGTVSGLQLRPADHFPKRDGYGVTRDGRLVFIEHTLGENYSTPDEWRATWLEDRLANAVAAVVTRHR